MRVLVLLAPLLVGAAMAASGNMNGFGPRSLSLHTSPWVRNSAFVSKFLAPRVANASGYLFGDIVPLHAVMIQGFLRIC